MRFRILTQSGNHGYGNSEIRRSVDFESLLSTYSVSSEPLVYCGPQEADRKRLSL